MQQPDVTALQNDYPALKEDQLVLVDLFDQQIGTASKAEAHRQGLLHRAFSVFLYHDNLMLIQQRHPEKYHSGGLWANACCSHPRDGEALTDAVSRRMQEEIGVTCPVLELSSFVYCHRFSTELYEYEYDHIFIGEYNGPVTVDPEEISAYRWVSFTDLAAEMVTYPDHFSVWFHTAAPAVLKHLSQAS